MTTGQSATPALDDDDEEDEAYLEITADVPVAAVNRVVKPTGVPATSTASASSWVSFEDSSSSSSRLPSTSNDDKTHDPFAASLDPFVSATELVDTTRASSPKTIGGLLPPPANTRPKLNAPTDAAPAFKPDFDSPGAQQQLTGTAVRRIPVKPLYASESMVDVFNPAVEA
jgi:hypothetical protein